MIGKAVLTSSKLLSLAFYLRRSLRRKQSIRFELQFHQNLELDRQDDRKIVNANAMSFNPETASLADGLRNTS